MDTSSYTIDTNLIFNLLLDQFKLMHIGLILVIFITFT